MRALCPPAFLWWQSVEVLCVALGSEDRKAADEHNGRNPVDPRERLTRGLTYSAVGPVDVTRGVVGLGVQSARATASQLRRRYREGRLAQEIAAAQDTIAQELAAAQEAVANLPQVIQDVRRSQRHNKRTWLIAAATTTVVLAGVPSLSPSSGARCAPSRRRCHRAWTSNPGRSSADRAPMGCERLSAHGGLGLGGRHRPASVWASARRPSRSGA